MVDAYEIQQILAQQQAQMAQAQNYSAMVGAAARGYETPPGAIIQPLGGPAPISGYGAGLSPAGAPMEQRAAAMGVVGAGAIGMAGFAGLQWKSMTMGMHKLGASGTRQMLGMLDPLSSASHGFFGSLRKTALRETTLTAAQLGGAGDMMKVGLPAMSKAMGVRGMAMAGVRAVASGAAMMAIPLAIGGGIAAMGRSVGTGMGQFMQTSSVLGEIAPHSGLRGISAGFTRQIDNDITSSLDMGKDVQGQRSSIMGLLRTAGASGEFKNTSDVKEFSKKFKKLIAETKAVATLLDKDLSEAYSMAKSFKGMGFTSASGQRNALAAVTMGARGTGLDAGTIMSGMSTGMQAAPSLGMSRSQGAALGGQITTGIGQRLKTNEAFSNKVFEATGLSGDQAAFNMNAQYMGLASRLGENSTMTAMLAVSMGEGGELDEYKLRRVMNSGMSAKELAKRSKAALKKRNIRSALATNRGSMVKRAMELTDPQQLGTVVGRYESEFYDTSIEAGIQSSTGMSEGMLGLLKEGVGGSPMDAATGRMTGLGGRIKEMRSNAMQEALDPRKIASRVWNKVENKISGIFNNMGKDLMQQATSLIEQRTAHLEQELFEYTDGRWNSGMKQAYNGGGISPFVQGATALARMPSKVTNSSFMDPLSMSTTRAGVGGSFLPMSYGSGSAPIQGQRGSDGGLTGIRLNTFSSSLSHGTFLEGQRVQASMLSGSATSQIWGKGGLGGTLGGGSLGTAGKIASVGSKILTGPLNVTQAAATGVWDAVQYNRDSSTMNAAVQEGGLYGQMRVANRQFPGTANQAAPSPEFSKAATPYLKRYDESTGTALKAGAISAIGALGLETLRPGSVNDLERLTGVDRGIREFNEYPIGDGQSIYSYGEADGTVGSGARAVNIDQAMSAQKFRAAVTGGGWDEKEMRRRAIQKERDRKELGGKRTTFVAASGGTYTPVEAHTGTFFMNAGKDAADLNIIQRSLEKRVQGSKSIKALMGEASDASALWSDAERENLLSGKWSPGVMEKLQVLPAWEAAAGDMGVLSDATGSLTGEGREAYERVSQAQGASGSVAEDVKSLWREATKRATLGGMINDSAQGLAGAMADQTISAAFAGKEYKQARRLMEDRIVPKSTTTTDARGKVLENLRKFGGNLSEAMADPKMRNKVERLMKMEPGTKGSIDLAKEIAAAGGVKVTDLGINKKADVIVQEAITWSSANANDEMGRSAEAVIGQAKDVVASMKKSGAVRSLEGLGYNKAFTNSITGLYDFYDKTARSTADDLRKDYKDHQQKASDLTNQFSRSFAAMNSGQQEIALKHIASDPSLQGMYGVVGEQIYQAQEIGVKTFRNKKAKQGQRGAGTERLKALEQITGRQFGAKGVGAWDLQMKTPRVSNELRQQIEATFRKDAAPGSDIAGLTSQAVSFLETGGGSTEEAVRKATGALGAKKAETLQSGSAPVVKEMQINTEVLKQLVDMFSGKESSSVFNKMVESLQRIEGGGLKIRFGDKEDIGE